MSGLTENPVVETAMRRSGPSKGAHSQFNLLLLAVSFALLILVPMAIGVCGCTMFSLAAVVMILATSLGVGNSAFGALTVEREKKTLDSLRLTQLTAHEVLLGKVMPELGTLASVVAVMAPTVVAAGLWGEQGPLVTFGAIGIAVLAGVFSSVMGLFLSSLFATTSQAVVAGWITKGVWLLLTPMLDLVVGAVFVQNVSPPVFTSVNPLAAFGVLDIPEAASGSRLWLPYIYPLATVALSLLMWVVTARRFASGMVNRGGLHDTRLHPVYRKGFGPAFLTRAVPALRENPSFLRELAAQVRAGAGRWPGYMVFLVLFLAPTFYAQSWTLNDMKLARHEQQSRYVQVSSSTYLAHGDEHQRAETPATKPGNLTLNVSTYGDGSTDTAVVVEGHKPTGCMRLALFQWAGVAMPKDCLKFYTVARTATPDDSHHPLVVPQTKPNYQVAHLMGMDDVDNSPRAISAEHKAAASASSLHVGIAGAIALLLLYLSIRFSAFLATAVTGERSRRTWEDLALTGISIREAMQGKVLGAMLLPLLQMTVVFPVLGVFVASGNLTVLDVASLYVYAVSLSVAASMLGLWASSRTTTSHDAHLRALSLVLAAFFVMPLMMPSLPYLLLPLAVVGATAAIGQLVAAATVLGGTKETGRAVASAVAWLAIAACLLLTPQALSPITAAVSFMPSLTTSHSFLHLLQVAPTTTAEALLNLCGGVMLMLSLSLILWNGAIGRLTDGRDGEAIAAEQAPEMLGCAG